MVGDTITVFGVCGSRGLVCCGTVCGGLCLDVVKPRWFLAGGASVFVVFVVVVSRFCFGAGACWVRCFGFL